jgi:putative photosynthetic complex assembly protein
MSEINAQEFPRGALYTAAGLIGFSLLLTSAVRLGFVDPAHTSAQVRAAAQVGIAAQQNLRFTDETDGSVLVTDATNASVVRMLKPGSNNFIRGVMRGLARDRRARGADSTEPFKLTRWTNGELTLEDAVTGRRIELGGFGTTNKESFDRLLPGSKAPPEPEVSPTRGFGL